MSPRLQVALDFLELSRALAVAGEAVDGGVDILEVGTPLIKSEGLDAVRKLHEAFPSVPIVADMKTIDAGRIEMEAAAKSGASTVVVLGLAPDATIRECVEAGRNYGFQIEVDLIAVSDPVRRAREVEAAGVDIIGVHCPIDVQMQGGDPFDVLRQVRQEVGCKVAVAGGIHVETAARAVEAGADIVIVGGAITKSADAVSATREIRRAMEGREVKSEGLYRRVTLENVREALGQVSTPNVSDAMHRGGEIRGVRPIQIGVKAFGPAVTVRTYPGDWAKPVLAIDECQEGDVIVIDACGQGPAVWGELASESCKKRGVAAAVIDGACRDVDAIRALGFPVWSRLVTSAAGEPKGFGEIGPPITVGGQRVERGDWILADDSGVVCIPQRILAEIVNRSMDVLERENRLRAEIHRGSTLGRVGELLRWEKK